MERGGHARPNGYTYCEGASGESPERPKGTTRELKPGDRVLVLVSTVEWKFLAMWLGPFEVNEKVAEVNHKQGSEKVSRYTM